jgi:hypothetical protein
MMHIEKLNYVTPAVRVVDTRLEWSFLQSGGNGEIDPGTDDPWGDF